MDIFTSEFKFFVTEKRKGKTTISGYFLTFLILGLCFVYLIILLNDLYDGEINPRILSSKETTTHKTLIVENAHNALRFRR